MPHQQLFNLGAVSFFFLPYSVSKKMITSGARNLGPLPKGLYADKVVRAV